MTVHVIFQTVFISYTRNWPILRQYCYLAIFYTETSTLDIATSGPARIECRAFVTKCALLQRLELKGSISPRQVQPSGRRVSRERKRR